MRVSKSLNIFYVVLMLAGMAFNFGCGKKESFESEKSALSGKQVAPGLQSPEQAPNSTPIVTAPPRDVRSDSDFMAFAELCRSASLIGGNGAPQNIQATCSDRYTHWDRQVRKVILRDTLVVESSLGSDKGMAVGPLSDSSAEEKTFERVCWAQQLFVWQSAKFDIDCQEVLKYYWSQGSCGLMTLCQDHLANILPSSSQFTGKRQGDCSLD